MGERNTFGIDGEKEIKRVDGTASQGLVHQPPCHHNLTVNAHQLAKGTTIKDVAIKFNRTTQEEGERELFPPAPTVANPSSPQQVQIRMLSQAPSRSRHDLTAVSSTSASG